jgi:hypothetical protein
MYTIFCCGSRAKRASSSLQTSRAELVHWLGCLTSRAESDRYLNEPARARSNRAELARYPLLRGGIPWTILTSASLHLHAWLTCETRKGARPFRQVAAVPQKGVLSAPAVAGTGQRVDSAWAWPSTRRVLRAFPFACTGTCRPFTMRGERAKHYTVTSKYRIYLGILNV